MNTSSEWSSDGLGLSVHKVPKDALRKIFSRGSRDTGVGGEKVGPPPGICQSIWRRFDAEIEAYENPPAPLQDKPRSLIWLCLAAQPSPACTLKPKPRGRKTPPRSTEHHCRKA